MLLAEKTVQGESNSAVCNQVWCCLAFLFFSRGVSDGMGGETIKLLFSKLPSSVNTNFSCRSPGLSIWGSFFSSSFSPAAFFLNG